MRPFSKQAIGPDVIALINHPQIASEATDCQAVTRRLPFTYEHW